MLKWSALRHCRRWRIEEVSLPQEACGGEAAEAVIRPGYWTPISALTNGVRAIPGGHLSGLTIAACHTPQALYEAIEVKQ